MADFGLFIGWKDAVRGRESKALEVFNEAVGLYTRLQESGEIESWDAVFLEPHGGDLNGFMLVRGSAANLAVLADSEEFRDLVTRADMYVRGIGIITGKTGEGVQRELARFQKFL